MCASESALTLPNPVAPRAARPGAPAQGCEALHPGGQDATHWDGIACVPSCVTWGGQTRPQGAHRILREEVREAPAKMHTALGLAHLAVRRPAWVRADPHAFPAVCRDFVLLHLTVAPPRPNAPTPRSLHGRLTSQSIQCVLKPLRP